MASRGYKLAEGESKLIRSHLILVLWGSCSAMFGGAIGCDSCNQQPIRNQSLPDSLSALWTMMRILRWRLWDILSLPILATDDFNIKHEQYAVANRRTNYACYQKWPTSQTAFAWWGLLMIGDPVFPKRSRWYWPLLVALAKEADQCISLKRKQLAIPSGRAGEGRGDENRRKINARVVSTARARERWLVIICSDSFKVMLL